MFVVVYSFKVKQGMDNEFRLAWEGLTKLIYEYEGSLGSRLHVSGEGDYIAYAQWPGEEHWEKSGDNLPAEAETFRKGMRETCSIIKVLHKLTVCADLLKNEQFNSPGGS